MSEETNVEKPETEKRTRNVKPRVFVVQKKSADEVAITEDMWKDEVYIKDTKEGQDWIKANADAGYEYRVVIVSYGPVKVAVEKFEKRTLTET